MKAQLKVQTRLPTNRHCNIFRDMKDSMWKLYQITTAQARSFTRFPLIFDLCGHTNQFADQILEGKSTVTV